MRRQEKIFVIILSITVSISLLKQIEAVPEVASEISLRSNVTEYKAETLKDPFQESLTALSEEGVQIKKEVPEEQVPKKTLPTLTIQGLVWGGNFPQAIINKKVLKIGDTIEGVRIIDINKNGVRVSFENQEQNLPSPATVNILSSKKKLDSAKLK